MFLLPNTPKFMYYDEYYLLPSRISLDNLQDNTNLTSAERTAKAFRAFADIDLERISNAEDTENYKSELESVQTAITNDLLEYWTNNPNLRSVFNIIREPVEPQKKGFRLFKKKEKQQLLHLMQDLSKEYQIIFTTHSTYLLGQMKEHIYCVTDGENGTVIRSLSEETDKETLLPLELYN